MAKKKKLPTDAEVKAEIETLLDLKYKVRSHSAFGDDNVASIEAQITVLESDMDEDEIYERFDTQYDDNDELIQGSQSEFDNALEARQWLDGEIDERPSEGWKPLIVK